MWRLLKYVGLLALVALVFRARAKKTTTAEISDVEDASRGELGHFVGVLNQVNDETDPTYVEAVERLRREKNSVLQDAEAILAERSGASFALRHSTLLGVSAMRDESALDLLSRVALNPQPLPPEPPPEIAMRHSHGSEEMVQHEVLALDALDGISALADENSAAALETLVRAAITGSRAVRMVALASLASRPDRSAQLERARSSLPDDLKHFGFARFAAIGDVPQVRDPRKHLAQTEQGGPASPPLPGDETDRTREPRSNPKAPRISTEGHHG